jgi:hypothetical protein
MKIKSNQAISWRLIALPALIAFIVLGTVVSHAGEIKSINVRGGIIKINDTADHVFEILNKSDMTDQKIQKDPNNPNSLLVVKNYNVNGQRFTLYFARVSDPGPYKVIKILTD